MWRAVRGDAKWCRRAAEAAAALGLLGAAIGCQPEERIGQTKAPPSILLVTLDTTRADRVGLESNPSFSSTVAALADRGRVFLQAYATAPMTLPSHVSMLTGRYPLDHGIHENGRTVDGDTVLLAEKLKEVGYSTAAFVSGYPLSSQFGLAQGFDHYDDDFGESQTERGAAETSARAIRHLPQSGDGPRFLWVHFFDPHEPYDPPEPFRSQHPDDPYQAEVAAMDHYLGRLVSALESATDPGGWRIVVVGDHGEGLGDHGENLHGNLLYQGVMRVPMVIVGQGIDPGLVREPVSARRIFDTILRWAGAGGEVDLLDPPDEPILAEALKPYLQYGWQPQVMGVRGRLKVIRSAETEIYDVVEDPGETDNLVQRRDIDAETARAIREYLEGVMAGTGASAEEMAEEARQRLAALGYVASGSPARLQANAPNPKDMTHLFSDLDRGSAMFVDGQYRQAIEVFDRVLEDDPENLMVAVRIAVARSILGEREAAEAMFARAAHIDPESMDLQHYLAMHYLRFEEWELAEPLFELVLEVMPNKLGALEAMARIRERQGRIQEATRLLERVIQLKPRPSSELATLGGLRMVLGDTTGAIRAFERSREIAGQSFEHHLELGVCYLADRQLQAARSSLDRVPRSSPAYPMALFKRAQVSVLLAEPEARDRIEAARRMADKVTAPLIESEALFREEALPR